MRTHNSIANLRVDGILCNRSLSLGCLCKNLVAVHKKNSCLIGSMNEFRSESPKPWSNATDAGLVESVNHEGPWKNFGSSVNALSFGFVATAILISLFFIMAIFEHLFRQRTPFVTNVADRSIDSMSSRAQLHLLGKLDNPCTVPAMYPVDFSVLMPGQQVPTFIAQPAPLPCLREGVSWPSHDHGLHLV